MMQPTSVVVLPGLDGKNVLLGSFVDLAPQNLSVSVYTLPDNPNDDYASLCDHLSIRIRELESCHLIAESFSGPLGILLAHRFPEIVRKLTLVATFADSPMPSCGRWMPWWLMCRIPIPAIVARYFFVGSDKQLAANFIKTVRSVSSRTVLKRIHCLMSVNVTRELAELRCSICYLRARQDKLVSKKSLDTIRHVNPSVVVREIDGPHLILQSRPQQSWKAILDK